MTVPIRLYKMQSICKNGDTVVRATVSSKGQYSTDMLAEDISERCSLSRPDVVAAIAAFEEIIAERLARGYTIHFHGLGWFRLMIKTKLTSEEEISQPRWNVDSIIKSWEVRFRPSTRLKTTLLEQIEPVIINKNV